MMAESQRGDELGVTMTIAFIKTILFIGRRDQRPQEARGHPDQATNLSAS